MSDLFEVPVSLSPRLAWLERHGLSLRKLESGKYEVALDDENFSTGADADDACVEYCLKHCIKHWNTP